LYGISPPDAGREVARLGGLFGLAELLDRRCVTLSTGQKQRLNLARALIHSPPAVLLDEPTLGLDVLGSQVVMEYVAHLRGEGKAVIVSTHRLDEAEREFGELKTLVADPSLKGQTTFSSNSGLAILRIAPEVIAGEIAAKRKDWDTAVLHLDRAIRFEDSLIYTEPHDWHAPARQNLAAVLLSAGRADEAETVLWDDLKRNPEHGWTLSLLARALRAQDKNDQAAEIDARLKQSWRDSDVTPATAARAR